MGDVCLPARRQLTGNICILSRGRAKGAGDRFNASHPRAIKNIVQILNQKRVPIDFVNKARQSNHLLLT